MRRSQYEQMFPALPPIADIPGRDRRKLLLLERLLLSLVGQRIRTLCKLHRKLLRPPFSFQNCTKMTKYEALEKNVVSNRKLSSLRQSLVRLITQKVTVCWGFWGRSPELDSQTAQVVGGGRGTGIEPSPRRPAYSLELRRQWFLAKARLSTPYDLIFGVCSAASNRTGGCTIQPPVKHDRRDPGRTAAARGAIADAISCVRRTHSDRPPERLPFNQYYCSQGGYRSLHPKPQKQSYDPIGANWP
jgi:hypothetical protein